MICRDTGGKTQIINIFMHAVLESLCDLLYPRMCAACGNWVGAGGNCLCWDCRSRLQWITPPFCRHCGDPSFGPQTHGYLCRYCLSAPPAFAMARSLTRYNGPCAAMIRSFKYGNACWTAAEMTQWLQEGVLLHFPAGIIDAVTFVPLSARKQRERTYNQAQILARGLARRMRMPYASGLIRQKDTVSQTRLNMLARRRNVRDAFTVRIPEWIRGRRILLVDDVMTTGATLAECARVLKNAGAADVYALTVSRR